jgi:two-component system CheB/CheR fusion protein
LGFNLQYIKGDAGKYLRLQEGIFTNNLLQLIGSELAVLIKTAIRKIKETGKDVEIKNAWIDQLDSTRSFNLLLSETKLDGIQENGYMLFFEDFKETERERLDFANVSLNEISKDQIEELEQQLKESKTQMQNLVEELETSNEELQSSNEELMASNEELQSINEELQSVNEELYTVNYEMQEKNRELISLNNDVTNLLNSTEVGTLFLDKQLRIRKFTPALEKLFDLKQDDVGRLLSNFTGAFSETARLLLLSDAKKVLSEFAVLEAEVEDLAGNFFIRRLSPFLTQEKQLDGVVVTFIDISHQKELILALEENEKRLEKEEKYYRSIIENNSFYVVKTNLEGNYTYLNNYFCDFFGVESADWLGKNSLGLIVEEDHELCIQTVEKCFAEPEKSSWVILKKPSPKGVVHSQWEFKILKNDSGEMSEILCIGHEITPLIQKQEELQDLVDTNIEQKNRLMQFTHIISHNVRSHVSNLKGVMKMAEHKKEMNQHKYWEMLNGIIYALDDTIHDLNDTINIQTHTNLPLKLLNFIELVQQVKQSLSHQIKNSRATITVNAAEGAVVLGNPSYLESMMLNLLTNAMKYASPERIPLIQISLHETVGAYEIVVSDNGLGIDLAKHGSKLFGMYNTFHQFKESKGLGLFITKVQAEAMKGTISVKSTLNAGSTFTITLPKVN